MSHHFDLVVDTAHKRDLTIGEESATVAGSAHATTLPFAEGVGQEPFGCHVGSIQVSRVRRIVHRSTILPVFRLERDGVANPRCKRLRCRWGDRS